MKFRTKVLLTILFLSIFPAIFVGFYGINNFQKITQEEIIYNVELNVDEKVENTFIYLEKYYSDVLLASQLPPVQGIIRSRDNGGIDPLDGSTIDDWNFRFDSIFRSIILSDQNIEQVRFIDEKGIEILRVSLERDTIYSATELQDKSDRYYFREGMKLRKGQVYVSEFDLNVEFGEIEKPFRPTVRFLTPVFSEQGERKGLIVFNVNFYKIFEELSSSSYGDFIVIDEKGQFLKAPKTEKSKEFSYILGENYSYFSEQPELIDNLKGNGSFKTFRDLEDEEVRVWKKIYFSPLDLDDRYWVLIEIVPESELFFTLKSFRDNLVLQLIIIFSFILLFSFLFARYLIKPISFLTESVKTYKGDPLEIRVNQKIIGRKDEIGKLAGVFSETIEKLKDLNKQLELDKSKLKTLDKAKDEFISLISHELKSPLIPVRGYLELMMKGEMGKLTKDQSEAVKVSYRNLLTLERLIEDILNLNRFDLKKIKLEKTDCDLTKIAKGVIRNLDSLSKEKKAEIFLKAKDKSIAKVDKLRINEVFTNLIKNAILYGKKLKKNKIIISISRKKSFYEIIVKDQGLGIPKEEVKNMFNKFYRAKTATQSAEPGVGLGLAVTKQFIELHGGHISVSSVEGKGTEFKFTIPIK